MSERRIYIVDDDDALRRSVETLLSAIGGFTTLSFDSGESFLAVAADLPPGCLLLDFNMPGLSGVDVLLALKQREIRHDAILLTGHGSIALAVEAMKDGATDYLEKPYDNRALLAAVEGAFERIEAWSGEVAAIHAARRHISGLTPRERDVLLGLIDGKPNKVIAYDLSISARTVEIYRANLMAKLDVKSVAEAVRIAFMAGLASVIR